MKPDKNQLIKLCIEKLQQRIKNAEESMLRAQEAANSEDKSSAGDKYETARAMGQLDRDMYAKQLNEAKQELAFFQKINFEVNTQISIGSLIITSHKNYFIAVGLGIIKIDNKEVIGLSPNAPLSKLLLGNKVGDEVIFLENVIKVNEIL